MNCPSKETDLFVSVILPVYNGEQFLAEAIDSVQHQDYQALEIIVVDDGSTDRTAAIVNQFQNKVRYVYQSNQGPAAARNCGIKQARGNVIAFLDADDLWTPNALVTQVNYLTSHPDVEIVQGLIQRMDLEVEATLTHQAIFKEIFQPYQCVNLGSALFRASVFATVGWFDESLRDNEDTDWFLRAWEQNVPKVVLPDVTLLYRKHGCNMTLQYKNARSSRLLKIYKRHIDRMRPQPQEIDKKVPTVSLLDYLGRSPG